MCPPAPALLAGRLARNPLPRLRCTRQASRLKYLAEAFQIPVLVTNQVTTRIGDAGGGGDGAQQGQLQVRCAGVGLDVLSVVGQVAAPGAAAGVLAI